MSTITNTIQEKLRDATEAEVTRFINAYGDGKPEDEENQEGVCHLFVHWLEHERILTV